MIRELVIERIMAKVEKPNGEDGCWVWTGSKSRKGYGHVFVQGRNRVAHRALYEALRDTIIPANMYACHACDNPPCVNPAHIFIGTQSDNMRDASQKGRTKGRPDACKRGHSFQDTGVYFDKRGRQHCRECKTKRDREWAERNRERRNALSRIRRRAKRMRPEDRPRYSWAQVSELIRLEREACAKIAEREDLKPAGIAYFIRARAGQQEKG